MKWRYLADDGAGAAAGLALDEAMMASHARNAAPAAPTLRLYTYASNAALCGRYQHLAAEIDLEACKRSGTAYNRRPTGGGAIVMGAGQLGVAVVGPAPAEQTPKALLVELSQGIVAGLAKLGIEASFGGKNDLKVAGRKIAGLGLYLDGAGAMLFHSSVLADLDIPFMLDVLDIPAAKLGDRATAAVAERVTTVSWETGRPWTGAELREAVAFGFRSTLGAELSHGEPAPDEVARRELLVRTKYETEDWLHQRSPTPDATATAAVKTPGGLVRVYLALQGDIIKSALFTGDFNEIPAPLATFEGALKWARLSEDALSALAAETMRDGSGLGVPPQELADTVLAAGRRALRWTPAAAPTRLGSCYFPDDQGGLT